MLEECLGVISFEDIGNEFGVLCRNKPVYMLPFAGRYRLVDFTLSNMINHGLHTIAVFTGRGSDVGFDASVIVSPTRQCLTSLILAAT
jgi:ADP-glucose pyrophosphorylase